MTSSLGFFLAMVISSSSSVSLPRSAARRRRRRVARPRRRDPRTAGAPTDRRRDKARRGSMSSSTRWASFQRSIGSHGALSSTHSPGRKMERPARFAHGFQDQLATDKLRRRLLEPPGRPAVPGADVRRGGIGQGEQLGVEHGRILAELVLLLDPLHDVRGRVAGVLRPLALRDALGEDRLGEFLEPGTLDGDDDRDDVVRALRSLRRRRCSGCLEGGPGRLASLSFAGRNAMRTCG